MGIVFDSAGSVVTAVGGSVLTWAHTIASNQSGIIIANIGANTGGSITSIKYAGTAMTKVIGGTNATGVLTNEIWYLLNPPAGLGTFNGTFSGTNPEREGLSRAYTGVSQATPIAGSVRFVGTGANSGSVTASMTADQLFTGGYFVDGNPGTLLIGTGRGTIGSGGWFGQADTGGGTLQWSRNSGNFVILAVQLGAAQLVVAHKPLLGVGY